MPSFFPFKQYGQSGKWCSDLFPHMNARIDELTFVHSMVAEQNSHGPAMYHMTTGDPRMRRVAGFLERLWPGQRNAETCRPLW